MSVEGSESCQLLVSPLPVPIPGPLPVSVVARERSVLLVDSRKPNARRILVRVGELLQAEGVALRGLEAKLQPVAGEDSARLAAWNQHRGLLLLGVFD